MSNDLPATETRNVMLQLGSEGGFQFSVNSAAYKTLKRGAAYNWASQNRIGSSPALQYTGPGKEKITLNGIIFPHYKGGLEQLPSLRKMASKGTPYILQDAKGESWGKWCIESIEETHTEFLSGGLPRKIEFALSLSKF